MPEGPCYVPFGTVYLFAFMGAAPDKELQI